MPSMILLFTRKVRCMMAVKIEVPQLTEKLQPEAQKRKSNFV